MVQEGQQHFQTVDQALAWIATQKKWIPVVYRNDGLLVGWRKNPERKQLNVEVWQLLVARRQAEHAPGRRGSADHHQPALASAERR